MSDGTAELKSQLREAEGKVKVAEAALAGAKKGRTKALLWSAIGGALLFAVGGQWVPGYQLDSTAKKTSSKVAMTAVSEIMAQLCVERFMREPGAESRMTALNAETGDWSQANYIRGGTWASTPNGEKTDHATAERCRDLITERASGETGKSS